MSTGGDEPVYLYRAIAAAELDHLRITGNYGSSPHLSGKYFALSLEGAIRFAGCSLNVGLEMVVTRTAVPASFFRRGYRFADRGGAEESVHFDEELLTELYLVMRLPAVVHPP